MKQVHVIISGNVIGVSFRAWTKSQAVSLGLLGWVKNVEDHVEASFQGEEKKINKMLALLKLGPPAAQVKEIKASPQKIDEKFNNFSVKY